jgi:pantoate--beta-alanine ligase
MAEMISQTEGARIDYIEIVELELLQPIEELTGRFAIALAVQIGPARLIDNIVLEIRHDEVREIPAL